MIGSGADVNISNKDGMTALSIAVLKGQGDIAEKLKKAGARLKNSFN